MGCSNDYGWQYHQGVLVIYDPSVGEFLLSWTRGPACHFLWCRLKGSVCSFDNLSGTAG